MTDNEIIKALEECQGEPNCGNCPYGGPYNCFEYLREDALALIKRQQEEIDLLKMDNERMTSKVFGMAMKKVLKEKVRAEAIKEFAEKLKEYINVEDFYLQDKLLLVKKIDNLVKEMGDENDA